MHGILKSSKVTEFLGFLLLGVLLSTVGYLCFLVMIALFGKPNFLIANTLALTFSTVINFNAYKFFFRKRSANRRAGSMTRYVGVVTLNLVATSIALHFLVTTLGFEPNVAFIISYALTAPIVYALNNKWVYKKIQPQP